jgi:hypothetical protein
MKPRLGVLILAVAVCLGGELVVRPQAAYSADFLGLSRDELRGLIRRMMRDGTISFDEMDLRIEADRFNYIPPHVNAPIFGNDDLNNVATTFAAAECIRRFCDRVPGRAQARHGFWDPLIERNEAAALEFLASGKRGDGAFFEFMRQHGVDYFQALVKAMPDKEPSQAAPAAVTFVTLVESGFGYDVLIIPAGELFVAEYLKKNGKPALQETWQQLVIGQNEFRTGAYVFESVQRSTKARVSRTKTVQLEPDACEISAARDGTLVLTKK